VGQLEHWHNEATDARRLASEEVAGEGEGEAGGEGGKGWRWWAVVGGDGWWWVREGRRGGGGGEGRRRGAKELRKGHSPSLPPFVQVLACKDLQDKVKQHVERDLNHAKEDQARDAVIDELRTENSALKETSVKKSVLVTTQEQLKQSQEKLRKAQAEAKELARVLAGGESMVTFPRGLEWAPEELSSVPYLDPGWLGLRVGEVVRTVVDDMLHLRRELQESRAREAEAIALLGEQAAAALLGVTGTATKVSDAGVPPSFLEPMGAAAAEVAAAAAAAGGAAYFPGVVRCRPELWSRGEVASCVRQLWAKRAQMEKTTTSAIPYPKVFRALKAESMAQGGGGAGIHMGMLVASALNFEVGPKL
jgi:hypothetical protein